MKEWIHKQKFCITGGAGVLGLCLIRKLREKGATHIIVLDQRDNPLLGRMADTVEFIRGSILNSSLLDKAMKGCTVVFHLAALVHAGKSRSDPVNYVKTNCLGTIRVLEICKKKKVGQVIYTSTGHVYGRPCNLPVNEKHIASPLSIYAATKLAGESFMHAYASSYGFPTVIARLANLYSSSSNSDTVVGIALQQVTEGSAIHIRNLAAVRDFIYIDDAAEALVRLAAMTKNQYESPVVNVSTGIGISIEELCKMLADAAVRQGLERLDIRQENNYPEEQIPAFVLDNSLLRDLTGWTPGITMEEGLSTALKERLRGSMVVA